MIDAARSLDDITIHLFDEADVVYVVLTADLSCLKNVQVVLKTMGELGYPRDKVQLVRTGRTHSPGSTSPTRRASWVGRSPTRSSTSTGGRSGLNSGAPFMVSRPDGPLAKAVSDFAATADRELSVVEAESEP